MGQDTGSAWNRSWDRAVELPLWARVALLVVVLVVTAAFLILGPVVLWEKFWEMVGQSLSD